MTERQHLHVWRYDATMPAIERPWIVSVVENGEALPDPESFPSWVEALAFAVRGDT